MSFLTGIKSGLISIWKDPVWSKVISAGILGIIAVVWAKVTNHTWQELYTYVIKILSLRLPVYLFLSAVCLYLIVIKTAQLLRKRKDPFWDVPMGNYTFKELYNILLTTTLPVPTMGMKMSGRQPPNDNFLLLFQTYYTFLNKGVTLEDNIQDGGYLYSVFAPRMVGFGLVEVYQAPNSNLPEVSDVAYKTSDLGHIFHAALDKLILANKLKELKQEKRPEGRS